MALTRKSFEGLRPYWTSISDHPPWLQSLLPRVIEARREIEAKLMSPSSYSNVLCIRGRKIEDILFQDSWSSRKQRDEELRENARYALKFLLVAAGHRSAPSPGVSWEQNKTSSSGTKSDYMIGAKFRQSDLDPVDAKSGKKAPTEMLYVLDECIQWGYWKVQPLAKHTSNNFMFKFYEVGEGGYDTITVPFDVLIACADFSDGYLRDFRRDDHPIMAWIKSDWEKVCTRLFAMEVASLAKCRADERKEFFRLIRVYGPEIVSGEITAEEIMEGASGDKYFYDRFITPRQT